MSLRPLAVVGAIAIACVVVLSARRAGTAPQPPETDAVTYALARDVPFAVLDIPDSSRPHRVQPPARIPLAGWKLDGDTPAVASPIRSRNLYFFKPNVGMQVVRSDGTEVPHAYFAAGATPRWTSDADSVRIVGWDGLPADDELSLVWPLATERERALNFGTSGAVDAEHFVRTSVQSGTTARYGLLLPAPAHAAWKIVVPPRAELRFAAGLVAPEVADGPPSDGATLVVEVETPDGTQELWRGALHPDAADAWTPITVDLSALSGRSVTLHARSEAGGDARFDYVFLADPVVATHRRQPRRVVMVFVDTLRPDHLGAFGYDRATSPGLDAIADAGARFTAARSVAPWTLPSSRTMLTGVDPEDYFDAPTLQGRLATAGFATAMFAGNIYLTANFGITRDWGLHEVELLPRAEHQVDRAIAWLDENDGRDAFVLLHLMDCHLPYEEPKSYREQFVQGDMPAGFRDPRFHRQEVLAARLDGSGRQYVRDRYDASIRYVDDQLARVWERLDPQDIVVFVSDHGEEFWDHGGFEHGHALWDELLRIPLIVRAPGIDAGTVVDAPVSMLDVTPTILDLVGLPTDGTKGHSLLAAAHGDAAARQALVERDQAFGRPLYGRERWGVLHDDLKYQAVGAREDVFDLGADPGEKKPLRESADQIGTMRAALGGALGRDVVVAYRVAARGQRRVDDTLSVRVVVPGGVASVWVGDDPTEASLAEVSWEAGADTFTATWPAPYRGSRDVWFVPKDPLADVTHRLELHASAGEATADLTIPADKPAELVIGARPQLLLRETVGQRALELGFGITPLPGTGVKLSGASAELKEELGALGYLTGTEKDRAEMDDGVLQDDAMRAEKGATPPAK